MVLAYLGLLTLALVVLFLVRPALWAPLVSLFQLKWFQIGVSVPFLTFLFDLVDLRPTISSFSFVASKTYGIYLVFRTVLGLFAAVVLGQTSLISNSLLLSFVSVITSVTVLQNFALKIGGNNSANLSELFDNYRSMMEDEAKTRVMNQKNAEMAELTDELSYLNLAYLQWQANILSQRNQDGSDPVADAQKLGGPEMQVIYLANFIVTQNYEFAKSLLEKANVERAGDKEKQQEQPKQA